MRSFGLALSFLTIIPVPVLREVGEKDMARSLVFYPLVGFLIGLILAALAYLGQLLELGAAGDALVIAVWILITGGLHMDGLMDTADGIFSGRDRQRKLEIMRDSRVGAMGAIVLVVVVLLKFSVLTSLSAADKMWVLLLAPAVGRFLMVYAVAYFPYARSGPGLGQSFGDQVQKIYVIMALILLLAGFFIAGVLFYVYLFISLFLGLILIYGLARILGGQTGDTFGASCESGETIFMMTVMIGIGIMNL